MNPKLAPRTRSPAGSDSTTFQMLQHPAIQQAVNRAANLKCIRALQEGKIRLVSTPTSPIGLRPTCYAPRMDLVDDPQSSKFVAIFELPGMKSNDLAVSIKDGHLIVAGERRPPYASSPRQDSANAESAATAASDGMQVEGSVSSPLRVPVQELRFGMFQRRVPVPAGIRESDVSASLAEGMLTVMWPRTAAAVVKSETPSPSISSSSRASLEAGPIVPFTTGSAATAGTASQ